jgi:adhesin transport system outer membrane protein
MLGRPLQPQGLAQSIHAPISLGSNAQDLLQQAQAHSPGVLKLVAQVRVAQEEVTERQADLKPEVYLRLESQYGSYNYPGSPTQNRLFVGASSHFGAGLSSMTQVRGAQARYDAALADVDSARVSLGEQVQADYAQAEAGLVRLSALEASLESSDSIARAWNRQFIAGRKTWLDVMNAMREQAQLEAQIADAKSSQLLLSWRLAITGRGLDNAMALGKTAAAEALGLKGMAQAQTQATSEWDAVAGIPLYNGSETGDVNLRAASEIDPAKLGVDLGISDGPTSPMNQEGVR